MTTSLLFMVLAASLHAVVLFEVWRFFHSKGLCQESDKHLVAVVGVGSVCFILVQISQMLGHPAWYDVEDIYAGLWSGFAIFNAALYYALAKIMADRRQSELGMDATDVRSARKKLYKARKRYADSNHNGDHV